MAISLAEKTPISGQRYSRFAELRDAWVRYQVLLFRDQKLTPDQHLATGKRLGDIQGPVTDINWHSDSSFCADPTRGLLHFALTVPEGAGDTVWADMCAAYDDLSPVWKRFLDPLTTMHDNVTKNFQRIFDSMGGEALAKMRKFLPPTEHPLICTRPECQCRWHWEPGSLALWDNYSTIHRGIFDFGQSHRLMHRVSFHDQWRPA